LKLHDDPEQEYEEYDEYPIDPVYDLKERNFENKNRFMEGLPRKNFDF